MARALLTPDELRRFSNDKCIIFEKGVRPVKADKFYYFKKPMARKMEALEISHNDIGEIERGEWRKYNPYNPYVDSNENKGGKQVKDLKVESLDDLFEDEPQESTNKNQTELPPILPNTEQQSNKENDDMDVDIQKELEAKFDELFGPIE